MSHLVLLELSEKHADRPQYLIPNLSLGTAPQLFTLTLQPLFLGADFLLLFLLPLAPAEITTLLGIPLKMPIVSLMSLACKLQVYLGRVP